MEKRAGKKMALAAAAAAVLAAGWLLTVNFGMLGMMIGCGLIIGWTEFI